MKKQETKLSTFFSNHIIGDLLKFRTIVQYLKYVVRHKWFVFLECVKEGIPLMGITHDASKFSPSEFFPYANYFYSNESDIHKGRDETGYYKPTDTGDIHFDYAWFLHQKRNKHHWQWWVFPQDEGGTKVINMPLKYRKEMLCDWKGAGKALNTPDTKRWYSEHKTRIQFHQHTRKWVENHLGINYNSKRD